MAERGSPGIPADVEDDAGHVIPARTSRAELVYAEVLKAVNEGRLAAGQRVLETDVADWLKVSRTPVREAIRRLESEGVLVRTDRGLVVLRMEDDQVMELYTMRKVLEGAAAGLAAQQASTAEIMVLNHILADEANTSETNAYRLAAINREFHTALWQASHNRYMLRTLTSLQNAYMRLRSTTFSVSGRPAKALKEHRAILKAVAARDADAAEQAARHHIQESLSCRLILNRAVRRGDDADSAGRGGLGRD